MLNFARPLYIAWMILPLFILGCKEKSADQKVNFFLKKTAEHASKNCPVQVDSILRLENVTAFSPATLRYNYSLKLDTTKYDLNAFKQSLRTTTLNSIKTNPDAQVFRKLFTTFEYSCNDSIGNFLFRITIRPSDYIKQ